MTTPTWHDGGPGPWILFFPLVWVAAVALVITVLRRTVRRGRGGPWHLSAATGEHSPVAVLGRRFAAGEIDEDEYWWRLSVLDERFGHRDLGIRATAAAASSERPGPGGAGDRPRRPASWTTGGETARAAPPLRAMDGVSVGFTGAAAPRSRGPRGRASGH